MFRDIIGIDYERHTKHVNTHVYNSHVLNVRLGGSYSYRKLWVFKYNRFPEPWKVWNFFIMYYLPVNVNDNSETCVINLKQFYGVICLYKQRIIKCVWYISTKNLEGIATSITQILGKTETCNW
jgi:hypothetical protein